MVTPCGESGHCGVEGRDGGLVVLVIAEAGEGGVVLHAGVVESCCDFESAVRLEV